MRKLGLDEDKGFTEIHRGVKLAELGLNPFLLPPHPVLMTHVYRSKSEEEQHLSLLEWRKRLRKRGLELLKNQPLLFFFLALSQDENIVICFLTPLVSKNAVILLLNLQRMTMMTSLLWPF